MLDNNVISKCKGCTGCGICSIVCSQKAISINLDKKGFLKPLINKKKCTNCGMCLHYCHALNNNQTLNSQKEIKLVRAKDENILNCSQSGGLFYLIASNFINNGGVVVGVALNECDFTAEYICTEDINELYKLRGSKYIQPKTNDIQQKILNKLKNGNKVLVSGSPCFISSLLLFLKLKNIVTSNLFTIDIICKDVPSLGLWKKHIHSKKIKKLIWVDFHDKKLSKKVPTQCYYSKQKGRIIDNSWGYIYNSMLASNDCCFKCKYKRNDLKRVSDITIGDAWNLSNKINIKPEDGYNVALLNTNKGIELLNSVNSQITTSNIDTTKEDYKQKALIENNAEPKNRKFFWSIYKIFGYRISIFIFYSNPIRKIKRIILKIFRRKG